MLSLWNDCQHVKLCIHKSILWYISLCFFFSFFTGYKIYKCHLGCVDSGHYHCCYCRQSIIRKNLFINHVQKCASTKVHIPCTEPSRECLETCALKPTNFPSSHSISTVSATCDPIPKPLTTPGLPRALTSPPVASTSGPSIISAPCMVDHSASETEHFSGTPPTPSSLTDSKTAVLHPTIVMPSDIQNIVSANQTECISTSNKKISKCRPKRTMCCFCNKILNKKNIKTHIQRRHSLSTPDVNINHHHPSTCIDRTNGISAVGGTVTGPVRPVHAQKYTRGLLHKGACEFEKGWRALSFNIGVD